MCGFQRIAIQNLNGSATAYSSMIFRSGIFEMPGLTLSHWASWKDQLNFNGVNDDNYLLQASLPTHAGPAFHPFYLIMLHEMAHNIPRPAGFMSRWTAEHDLAVNALPNRDHLCSYWCPSDLTPLTQEQVFSTYEYLFRFSHLLTLYSSQNYEEDFADSFAYYVTTFISGHSYTLRGVRGMSYDVGAKLLSPEMATKKAMLDEIFSTLNSAAAVGQTLLLENYIE